MLEFDAGVRGCEAPVGLGMIGVAVAFPGGDFVNHRMLVGNATVEALRGEHTDNRVALGSSPSRLTNAEMFSLIFD